MDYRVYCFICGEECKYTDRSEDYGIYLCSQECAEILEEELELISNG